MTPSSHTHRPVILLLLIAMGLYLLYVQRGFLPLSMPDTNTYREWENLSWREILAHVRTPGYPWLLSWSGYWGGHFWLPPFQFALHVLAVILFYGGLRALTVLPWTAFFAAAPLLFSPMIQFYGNTLLSDAPGLSLAVMSLALLYVAMVKGGGWWWWWVALAMAATWLVRPMYLFIVPLFPLLTAVLGYMMTNHPSIKVTGAWKKALWVAVLPFLLYCTMRWVTVDHFGVVSFGGFNIAGIATPLLDQAMVPRLPTDLQPLATDILLRRKDAGLGYPVFRQGGIKYNPWYNEYNPSIHQVALPAAMARHPNSSLLANQDLARLSHAIILQRPFEYIQWLSRSMVEAGLTLVRLDPLIQGLFLLLVLLWVKRLVQRPGRGEIAASQQQEDHFAFALLAVSAISFFLVGSLEVVMVEPPIERYVMGTGVLIPALLGVGCYRLARG